MPIPRYAAPIAFQAGRMASMLYNQRRNIAIAAAAAAAARRSRRPSYGPRYDRGLAGEGFTSAPVYQAIERKKREQRIRSKYKKIKKLKGKKLSKEVLKLSNQVGKLKHESDSTVAELNYRYLTAQRVTCGISGQNILEMIGSDKDQLEAVLTQLKYWDPSTSTFVTSSGIAGTNEKKFLFNSISSKLTLRNNYQSDVELMVWLCKPRVDTDSTVTTAYTNGINDDLGNVTTFSTYGSLPTDYKTTTDFWSFKRVCKKVLSNGDTFQVSHGEENVEYDPSFSDSHNLVYQKGNKAFQWLIMVRGTLGHDGAAAEGTLQAGVDCMIQNVYKVRYSGGANFKFTYISENLGDLVGPVQGKCPIPDLVNYSST